MINQEALTREWRADTPPSIGVGLASAIITPGVKGGDVRLRLTFAGPSILTLTLNYRDAIDFAQTLLDASQPMVRAAGGEE